jgi:hypothetical protein
MKVRVNQMSCRCALSTVSPTAHATATVFCSVLLFTCIFTCFSLHDAFCRCERWKRENTDPGEWNGHAEDEMGGQNYIFLLESFLLSFSSSFPSVAEAISAL